MFVKALSDVVAAVAAADDDGIPPGDRSSADVWTALGGDLKPSLDIVASAPVDTGAEYTTPPPLVDPPLVDPQPAPEPAPVTMRRWSARERRG